MKSAQVLINELVAQKMYAEADELEEALYQAVELQDFDHLGDLIVADHLGVRAPASILRKSYEEYMAKYHSMEDV